MREDNNKCFMIEIIRMRPLCKARIGFEAVM